MIKDENSRVRVRFAPAPSGELHSGNMRTAVANYLFARGHDGIFVLRIEDTAAAGAPIDTILQDLEWMGIKWDEGPFRQSERSELYKTAIKKLLDSNEAYRCFCSAQELEARRKTLAARGLPPRYSGKCAGLDPDESRRRADAGEPFALRFRMDSVGTKRFEWKDMVHGNVSVESGEVGDFIILRNDGRATYFLAAAVDDGEMGITHIIRGDDHLANTPRQTAIMKQLGYKIPEFGHLPLIFGRDGKPLSKRRGAVSIAGMRNEGMLPEATISYLAGLGTPDPDAMPSDMDKLVEMFDLSSISHQPPTLDIDRMKHYNARLIREMPVSELARRADPFMKQAGLDQESIGNRYETALDAVREEIQLLGELPKSIGLFFGEKAEYDEEALNLIKKEESIEVVRAAVESIEALGNERVEEIFGEVAKKTGLKGRKLYAPLRAAITGKLEGPQLKSVIYVLGGETIHSRLKEALKIK